MNKIMFLKIQIKKMMQNKYNFKEMMKYMKQINVN